VSAGGCWGDANEIAEHPQAFLEHWVGFGFSRFVGIVWVGGVRIESGLISALNHRNGDVRGLEGLSVQLRTFGALLFAGFVAFLVSVAFRDALGFVE
jgi:hypothetical protein